MKLSLLLVFFAFGTAHAIPPAPPSPIKKTQEVVTCKDLNALSEAEIEFLNEDPERIVSVDHDLREVCFKIN